jgi:hypothetical protein
MEGCARTLTWVDVIPSTGTTVGDGEDGSTVFRGTTGIVAGSVEVLTDRVGLVVISPCALELQAVLRSATANTAKTSIRRMDTIRF